MELVRQPFDLTPPRVTGKAFALQTGLDPSMSHSTDVFEVGENQMSLGEKNKKKVKCPKTFCAVYHLNNITHA